MILPRHYNVNIFRIYLAYLRDRLHWTDEQIEALFKRFGSESSVLQYEDNWFDQAFADNFNTAVVNLTGDPDIAYKVGRYSIDESAKGVTGRIVAGLLSPGVAYRSIERIAQQYSRGAQVRLIDQKGTTAILRAEIAPDCDEKEYQCRNRLGMLESVPTLFDLPSAVVEHPKCYHHGDPYCEYAVKWIEPRTRYIAIITLTVFGAFLLAGYMYGLNLALAAFFSGGFASGVYAVLHYQADKRLKVALSEQIEGLRISAKTIQRRHQESLLVSDINNLVNKLVPLQRLCVVAAEAIHQKMGYDRVSIFLVDKIKGRLVSKAFAGVKQNEAEHLEHAEFNLDSANEDGLFVKVVNSNKPIFVNDVGSQLDKLSERSKALAVNLGVNSFIAVPISFESTVYGIIAVDNGSSNNLLTSNDLELLNSVAKPLAVSISNSLMFQELEHAKEVLEQRVIERTAELQAARDEAVLANNAKSEFLANMSHELRTPLTAVIGYAALIKYQAKHLESSQLNDDAERITKSGEHLLDMINGILDLAKIEAGKMELHLEEFRLQDLLDSIKTIATPLATKNQNQFIVVCEDENAIIYSDETKLRQIIINLISNACKFTHDGNIVLRVSASKRTDELIFEVTDTGIGIPDDKMHNLFKEFSQVDSSTTKQYGGTGLGLVLCKRFAEMLGGSISVHSRVNVGSTFTVMLPQHLNEMREQMK